MKNMYIKRIALLLVWVIIGLSSVQAQVRIFKLDPATNSVTLKNFGTTNSDISGLWFCNFPAYAQVNGMTSVTTLAPDEEVIITSTIDFDVADGEFGLYNTNSFAAPSAMEDYLQWGSANHQREPVAVAAGLWDAGTFVDVAPPFEYTGDGLQNGVAFWATTTLGVDDFENLNSILLYPNPASNMVTLEFSTITSSTTAIEIFDVLGKQIYKSSVTTKSESIDVSNWNSGVYLMRITAENSSSVHRFIKK